MRMERRRDCARRAVEVAVCDPRALVLAVDEKGVGDFFRLVGGATAKHVNQCARLVVHAITASREPAFSAERLSDSGSFPVDRIESWTRTKRSRTASRFA